MPNSRLSRTLAVVYVGALALTVAACGKPQSSAERTQLAYSSIDREAFNFRAAELHLPLFWREDTNKNGALESGELAVLTAVSRDQPADWVDAAGKFTKSFADAYT